MDSFYNIVLNKLEEIEKIEHTLKPCVDIFKRYSYNINSFCDYNFSDYLYMLYIGANLTDFNHHINIIDKYKDKLDRVKYDDLDRLIDLYNAIITSHKDKKTLLITSDNYLEQLKEFENKPFNKDLKQFLKRIFSDEKEKIDFIFYNTFFKDFLNYNDRAIFFGIIEIYKLKYIKKYSNNITTSKDKIIKKAIKKFGDLSLKVLELVQNTKNNIEGEYNSFQRKKSKQINLYKKLLNDIKSNDYIDIEKYRKLLDPNIFLELLFYNSKFYNDDYIEENKKNSDLSIDKLEELLLKENINVDVSKINISIDEAISKINILLKTKSLLKYNNIILHILNNISINNLIKLTNFKDEKIYDEEFLLDNILEFKNEEILNNFINNILLLNNSGLNISNIIKYDKNILFTNNKKIEQLLKIYMNYNINIKGDCYNFEWLINDMSYIIDKFIEIGQYELICNNLSLLNNNSNIIIKRCILSRDLNNGILNEQGKLKGNLRKEENFIISDVALNETILTNYDLFMPKEVFIVLKTNNPTYMNLYDLDILNNYLINKNTYKFDSILISKNKIIRNLNILYNSDISNNYSSKDILIFAIIYEYPYLLTPSNIEYLRKIINIKTKTLKLN